MFAACLFVCFFSHCSICICPRFTCTSHHPHAMICPVWLMWPLHLCDVASSAFVSFNLHCFWFDLSPSNDTLFHAFCQVSSEFSPDQLSLLWSSSCFNEEQQNNCHLLLSKWLCALMLHELSLHTQICVCVYVCVCRRSWEEKAPKTRRGVVLNC